MLPAILQRVSNDILLFDPYRTAEEIDRDASCRIVYPLIFEQFLDLFGGCVLLIHDWICVTGYLCMIVGSSTVAVFDVKQVLI